MSGAAALAGFALLGLLAGVAHVVTLAGNARLWVAGRRWQALTLQAVRLAVGVSAIVVAAHQGAWSLLLLIAGFLAASAAVTLWGRRRTNG